MVGSRIISIFQAILGVRRGGLGVRAGLQPSPPQWPSGGHYGGAKARIRARVHISTASPMMGGDTNTRRDSEEGARGKGGKDTAHKTTQLFRALLCIQCYKVM